MDVKLTYLHDPDKTYMVRVCILVADAIVTSPGSVIERCAECDRPIWVDKTQFIPEPDGVVVDGEVWLCLACTAIHAMINDEPMQWLGPEST